ncbi:MAG: monovalent cation/H(+) antiporter subunit G [Pseudomonadota bacterium]|nr:monovalent cation/H(+) antiporter subunit G [Pseudomonadota bacterium]
MMHAASLPAWAALLTAFFVLVGAGLALFGAIGTLRFATFFERVHAPTLGTSWGTGAMVMGSILYFSVLGSRPVVHEILIGVFITVTTPVTLMLLARAVLYRDRSEGVATVPPRAVTRHHGHDMPDEAGTSGDEQKPR